MNRLTIAAATCLTLGIIGLAAPVQAQGTKITDPAGDTGTAGLDITGVTFSNRTHAFVASLTFVTDTVSNVIVAVETREGHVVRLVSEHSSHGADSVVLLGRHGQTLRCEGLSSTWDRDSAVLVLRMPSTCLLHGDYQDVHSWALTEDPSSGRDVDYAPEDANGDIRFSKWLSRG